MAYKNEFNVYFIFIYLINTQLGMSVCPIRVKMREHVSMELVTTAASVGQSSLIVYSGKNCTESTYVHVGIMVLIIYQDYTDGLH